MKSAGAKWRTWKHNLRKDFILPNEHDPKKLYEPPASSGISEKEWNQFVIASISSDFKVCNILFDILCTTIYYHLYKKQATNNLILGINVVPEIK